MSEIPSKVYGYWSGGSRNCAIFRISLDKAYAEMNADGFIWDNPRVREFELVPIKQQPTKEQSP